jgi:thiol:disulfide interchange protein DsbD
MIKVKYWFVIILAFCQFTMAESSTSEVPALLSGSGGSFNADQDIQFLAVEDAFQLSAWQDDQAFLVLNWHIAKDYYIYKDRFDFRLNDTEKTALQADLPDGKKKYDEYFGDTEVFYNQVNARIPYEEAMRAVTAGQVIKLSYQGCADAGLCYPPQTKFIQLNGSQIEIFDSPPVSDFQKPGLISEEQGFTRLLVSANLLSIIGLFYLAGLALTFTPCVLPMVPIISGIILSQDGQPSRRQSFVLSACYVLGMALTYALAGTITGFFGAELNLQAKLQSPWVLTVFASLFVVLALAMFGAYELRLPHKLLVKLHHLSNRQNGGTYSGVALMGSFSSLIVSPCVSAPLAGALVYIGSTSDPVLGGLALFALGMGMGTPLLLIGTFGTRLLPKTGHWLNQVKVFFGVLMLGVAIWMLDRFLPPPITLGLFGLLALGYGLYLGLPFFRKILKPSYLTALPSLVFVLYGALLMAGATQGSSDLLTPFANLSGPAQQHATLKRFVPVTNLNDLQHALAEAKTAGLPVMLDVYADWCVSCQILEHRVFTQEQISKTLENFTLIRADVTANVKEHQQLLKHFGLFGPPSLLFFSEIGRELKTYRIQGEISAYDFNIHLLAILENTSNTPQFAAKR